MRKYRNYTDEDLSNAVKNSKSIADVCRYLSLAPVGGNYRTIKVHVIRLKLSTDHFTGQSWNKYSVTDITAVKCYKSLKRGLMQQRGAVCESCKLSRWLNRGIPLELEHVDGNSLNHAPTNLKLLCPNCHACTHTHRRRKSLSHPRQSN